MCTLTWSARRGRPGYELWFNRDEVNSRAAEQPPRRWEPAGAGAGFYAPVDGARGGTWLAVNDHGLTVALLNEYGVSWRPPAPARSRGDLVVAAARTTGLADMAVLLRAEALRNLPAFTLVALEAGGGCASWQWDGARVDEARGAQVASFFSSSSYRPAEVIAARRAAYARAAGSTADGAARRAYHFHHDPARAAESVLMCRPDAHTRSVCRVTAGDTQAEVEYVPVARRGAVPEPGAPLRWVWPVTGRARA